MSLLAAARLATRFRCCHKLRVARDRETASLLMARKKSRQKYCVRAKNS